MAGPVMFAGFRAGGSLPSRRLRLAVHSRSVAFLRFGCGGERWLEVSMKGRSIGKLPARSSGGFAEYFAMSNIRIVDVALPISESGCPFFDAGEGARIALEVQPGSAPDADGIAELRHVCISGNRSGLRALAAALLALAESDDVGYHIHIDEEVNRGNYSGRGGFGLLLEIIPERRRR